MIRAWEFALYLLLVLVVFSMLPGCTTGHAPTHCELAQKWSFDHSKVLTEEDKRQLLYFEVGVCTGETVSYDLD